MVPALRRWGKGFKNEAVDCRKESDFFSPDIAGALVPSGPGGSCVRHAYLLGKRYAYFERLPPRTLFRAFLLTIVAAGLIGFGPALTQKNEAPQDETLFGSVQSSGGYGAPTVALPPLTANRLR
jgi:hypothetical protein